MNLRVFYISFSLVCALAVVCPRAEAQAPIATYGTKFTLAIPEGADALVDPTNGGDSSELYILIVSQTPGSLSISSPSGYSQRYCYDSSSKSQVQIPHRLMLIPGEGKSSKGLILQTTTPVQIILLDRMTAGGEITQVYPDSALGTEYRIGTWGIFNDPGENNKTEFVVTAPEDNTTVTVTPSVQPLGRPDASPFSFTLNAGECYIVKADINALPSSTSLSGSLVTATKPVSVISALTCGYAPIGAEACNELLNMQLPRSLTDTVFYVAPFSTFTGYSLMFVADAPDFFVIDGSGLTYSSTNGVTIIPFTSDPNVFYTTVPAQCYQLSVGYELNRDNLSDPSMINVLPRSQWLDSVEWISPDLSDPIFGAPFPNYISVIYPRSAQSQLKLDGVSATALATPKNVPGSNLANIVIEVPPGRHSFTSSEPVFAFASGFSYADAYSYNVGEKLPAAPAAVNPADTINSTMIFDTITQPAMCQDFDVAIRLIHPSGDAIEQAQATLTFDPLYFTYLGVTPGPVAKGNSLATTTTTNSVTVSLTGNTKIVGDDTVCIMHFHCGINSGSSPMTLTSTFAKQEPFCQTAARSFGKVLGITAVNQLERAAFSISVAPAIAGRGTTGSFSLVQAPQDPIRSVRLRLTYDHQLLAWTSVSGGALVGSNILPSPIRTLDATTDEVTVSFSPQITQTGELLKLGFDVYVTDSVSTVVTCSTDISNDRPCPLSIVAEDTSTVFTSGDTCGTSIIREFLQGVPPTLKRIVPNPTTGRLQLSFDRSFGATAYRVDVTDVLGQRVARFVGTTIGGSSDVGPIDLGDVPAGLYFLKIELGGLTRTASVLVRN